MATKPPTSYVNVYQAGYTFLFREINAGTRATRSVLGGGIRFSWRSPQSIEAMARELGDPP